MLHQQGTASNNTVLRHPTLEVGGKAFAEFRLLAIQLDNPCDIIHRRQISVDHGIADAALQRGAFQSRNALGKLGRIGGLPGGLSDDGKEQGSEYKCPGKHSDSG